MSDKKQGLGGDCYCFRKTPYTLRHFPLTLQAGKDISNVFVPAQLDFCKNKGESEEWTLSVMSWEADDEDEDEDDEDEDDDGEDGDYYDDDGGEYYDDE